MRSAVLVGLLATVWAVAAAEAETRIFVIANAPDGYGVDQCLASGAHCGALIADAYCQSQHYARAASFRRMRTSEAAGAIPAAGERAAATPLVAIECTR